MNEHTPARIGKIDRLAGQLCDAIGVGVAALSFPIARAAFLRHWRRVSAREMSEQKLLR